MKNMSWKIRSMRVLAAGFLAVGLSVALANEGFKLDRAPIDLSDNLSLQRGAQHFANYCLTCHGAQYMRYNLLTKIGLSETEIKNNLILTGAKIGDTMTVVLNPKDAKLWFGVPPPDLSVEARVRGADWLYTYLHSFYRDDERASGWNNRIYPGVAMPHVLYELQGEQQWVAEPAKPGEHAGGQLVLSKPGKLSPQEYDQFTADLVNYLVFIAEPVQETRIHIGFIVMIFLGLAFIITRALKHEYWKDVH
jgi:ubiquinol-cytochrome c reductase cytochrome c1 subunit